jgi:hypothetical protein
MPTPAAGAPRIDAELQPATVLDRCWIAPRHRSFPQVAALQPRFRFNV